MVERNPIFKAKADNQIIAYIEDTEVFDLMGNRRCNYNPITGNLLELNGRRIIGHVSLTSYFIGLSSIADELFSGRAECQATVLFQPIQRSNFSRTAIRLPNLKRFNR